MTRTDLVEWAADALENAGVSFGHGTTEAWDEAAWLVLWRLGLPLDTPLDDTPVAPEAQAAVRALVAQRIATRQPAAYLTGEAWLQGLAFHCDPRAIVPRSLIAELIVSGALDAWWDGAPQRILDLCTGGASLAIHAALRWPQAAVDASDLSTDALAVAGINVQRYGLAQRLRLLQGDGCAPLQDSYDLVLCNPPYVNARSMQALPAEYRAEPELALAGGTDGMDFVRRLLRDIPRFMTPAAVLVLEIGHERAHFEAAFPRLEALWQDTSAGADQVCVLTHATLQTLHANAAGHNRAP
ncbi:MAG: 50S ribosomal protein L3 N(5)-glutamine methyltransferase [Rhodoferax sp.]